jgi:gluconate 2-dehydrogenase alpha chain
LLHAPREETQAIDDVPITIAISLSSTIRRCVPIGFSRALTPDAPKWGMGYKQWLRENAGTIAGVSLQFATNPYEHNFLDLDPEKKDPLGLPVVRITYQIGDNEANAGEYLRPKLEEVLKEMGAAQTWSFAPVAAPIYSHAYGGTRMGDDELVSVTNKYGQTHEVPNLVVLGASNFPNPSGYNPTETLWAHSLYAADYIGAHFDDIAV